MDRWANTKDINQCTGRDDANQDPVRTETEFIAIPQMAQWLGAYFKRVMLGILQCGQDAGQNIGWQRHQITLGAFSEGDVPGHAYERTRPT